MNQVIRVLKTPLTLIALLAILIGGGYWGMQAASAPVVREVTPCVPTDVGKELTPNRVSLRVLNGGSPGGSAKTTAAYVRAYGFDVVRVNNTDRQITKTVIVGFAANSPEVLLTQQFFPDSIAEGDGRVDHVVDVLLGTESKQAPAPTTSVPVSGTVCLPPRALPSASPTK